MIVASPYAARTVWVRTRSLPLWCGDEVDRLVLLTPILTARRSLELHTSLDEKRDAGTR